MDGKMRVLMAIVISHADAAPCGVTGGFPT